MQKRQNYRIKTATAAAAAAAAAAMEKKKTDVSMADTEAAATLKFPRQPQVN